LLKALIVTEEKGRVARLGSELAHAGLLCSIDSYSENVLEKVNDQAPDVVLVAIDGAATSSEAVRIAQSIKKDSHLPVIALLSREALNRLDTGIVVDDFVVEPWDATEVVARTKRLLTKTEEPSPEIIECGDLTIDLAKCEVSVGERLVTLTFKEFELLRFLASNMGRVFTREALLNEVWGYEYYGGDRTVDVHIRRLRSKLEDPAHTFIETVRNIGYKFKESA
jgi:two-component system alkaline phosphatase synthesis response regulator PhoP